MKFEFGLNHNADIILYKPNKDSINLGYDCFASLLILLALYQYKTTKENVLTKIRVPKLSPLEQDCKPDSDITNNDTLNSYIKYMKEYLTKNVTSTTEDFNKQLSFLSIKSQQPVTAFLKFQIRNEHFVLGMYVGSRLLEDVLDLDIETSKILLQDFLDFVTNEEMLSNPRIIVNWTIQQINQNLLPD